VSGFSHPARRHAPALARFTRALAVIRNIALDHNAEQPVATGGELVLLMPWKVNEDGLAPIAYDHRRGFELGRVTALSGSRVIAESLGGVGQRINFWVWNPASRGWGWNPARIEASATAVAAVFAIVAVFVARRALNATRLR
jgi:hypothetical protein